MTEFQQLVNDLGSIDATLRDRAYLQLSNLISNQGNVRKETQLIIPLLLDRLTTTRRAQGIILRLLWSAATLTSITTQQLDGLGLTTEKNFELIEEYERDRVTVHSLVKASMGAYLMFLSDLTDDVRLNAAALLTLFVEDAEKILPVLANQIEQELVISLRVEFIGCLVDLLTSAVRLGIIDRPEPYLSLLNRWKAKFAEPEMQFACAIAVTKIEETDRDGALVKYFAELNSSSVLHSLLTEDRIVDVFQIMGFLDFAARNYVLRLLLSNAPTKTVALEVAEKLLETVFGTVDIELNCLNEQQRLALRAIGGNVLIWKHPWHPNLLNHYGLPVSTDMRTVLSQL